MLFTSYFVSSLSILSSLVSALESQQFPLAASLPSEDSPFHVFRSENSPNHSIRIQAQNSSICATNVSQYTGWLDVGHAHFFFWYFAAEKKPVTGKAPLALWMTGGPGGSSMLGMLQELGPCLINQKDNGSSTVYNPHGWNKDTAYIFVDQPAGVGFSYVDEGYPLTSNSFVAAADMHHFLQLFISQVMPEHASGPFVISGESYAGHYIPTLAAQIVEQNTLYPRRVQVPLTKVMIGNGLISPADRIYGYWETLCTTNPGVSAPIFNKTRCDFMADNMPRCLHVIDACYKYPDAAICNAALEVCDRGVISLYDSESHKGGRNRFDITAPCDRDDICYASSTMIETYLNSAAVREALHVPHALKYSMMSSAVATAFGLTNDHGINTETQIRYILENEVDVLIYQGNLDLACNTAGNLRWANSFLWKGATAFSSKLIQPWYSTENGKVIKAGYFKEVSLEMVVGSAKNTTFAFVAVDNAGHMVPQDKPEVALDLLTRWLKGKKWA